MKKDFRAIAAGLALLALAPVTMAAFVPSPVMAAAPGSVGREFNMMGYYGNTLVIYLPRAYENHVWYNADGTSIHFNGSWSDDKGVDIKAYEEKWKPI